MTISPTQICNLALSNIGARSSVEDFTTEDTAEANECLLWYDFSREQALRMHNWSFARKRLTLASHAVDPPDGLWSFRYQYPFDCLKALRLVNPFGRQANAIPYDIETAEDAGAVTRSILTDLDNACLLYTFDVKDTTLFTPFFVELLSYGVAQHIAFALTGKREIKADMLKIYTQMTLLAPRADAQEGIDEEVRDADQIRARGAGFYDRMRYPRQIN